MRAELLEPTPAVEKAIDEAQQLTAILTASSQTASANLERERKR